MFDVNDFSSSPLNNATWNASDNKQWTMNGSDIHDETNEWIDFSLPGTDEYFIIGSRQWSATSPRTTYYVITFDYRFDGGTFKFGIRKENDVGAWTSFSSAFDGSYLDDYDLPQTGAVWATTSFIVDLSAATEFPVLRWRANEDSSTILLDNVYFYPAMELEVSGAGAVISNGNTTPTSARMTDFGSVNTSKSAIRIFSANNIGYTTLNISSVSLSGSGDFSIYHQPESEIGAQSSDEFSIQFSPSSTGEKTATVTVNSDNPADGTYTFAIKGTGASVTTGPEIIVYGNYVEIPNSNTAISESDNTDFGVVTDTNATKDFLIYNIGDSDLTISSLSFSTDPFTISSAPSATIAAGNYAVFTALFTPVFAGPTYSYLTINNSDSDEGTYRYGVKGVYSGLNWRAFHTFNTSNSVITNNETRANSGTTTLKDSSDGSALSAQMAISGTNPSNSATTMTLPTSGEPAYELFNGEVDMRYYTYINSGALTTMTFSSLQNTATYSIYIYSQRGASDRETGYTLTDLTSATPAHQGSVNITEVSTYEAALEMDNAEGELVSWTDILTGSDGDFVLEMDVYSGSYGYIINLCMEEYLSLDVYNPLVDQFVPSQGNTTVSVVDNMKIVFNEAVVKGAGNITLYNNATDAVVEVFPPANVTLDSTYFANDTIVIDPLSDLDGNTGYYFLVDTNAVEDSSGNAYAGIASKATWFFQTVSSKPSTQVDTLSFSSVGDNQMTIGWEGGVAGNNTLVLVKADSAVNSDPVDATSYTANSTFGSGSELGTGNYAVYNSNGNSVTVTGLAQGTQYYVELYAFSGSGGSEGYLTPGLAGDKWTTGASPEPASDVSGITVTAYDRTSIDLAWTVNSGNYTLVIAKSGPAVSVAPIDETSYTGNAIFGDGDQVGTSEYVVYADSGNTVSVTGLSAETTYHFAFYAFNGQNGSQNYLVNTTPSTSRQTMADEPTTDSSSVVFSDVRDVQMDVYWERGNGDGCLVVAKDGGAVSATPTDLELGSYTANAALGSGTDLGTNEFIVYSGTGNTVTVTGLTLSNTYHFAVYEYNGSGDITNFKTDSPATGSEATVLYDPLSYSTTVFYEDADYLANDGSIDSDYAMLITISDETFTGSDGSDLNAGGNVTVSNAPAGLTPVFTRNAAGTQLTVTFSGTATNHADSDDVSNLSFEFNSGAFTGGTVPVLSTKTGLQIDFIDPYDFSYMTAFTSDDSRIVGGGDAYDNFGASVGYQSGTIGLFKFDLSDLPDGATIVRSSFHFTDKAYQSTMQIVFVPTEDNEWVEGTKDNATATSGEHSYNYRIAPSTVWSDGAGLGEGSWGSVYDHTGYIGQFTFVIETGSTGRGTIEVTTAAAVSRIQQWLDDPYFNNGVFLYNISSNRDVILKEAAVETKYLPQMTIQYLDPQGPEISVSGNGIVIPDGDTTPRMWDKTHFGTVAQNSDSVTHTFTMKNTGTENLALTNSPYFVEIDDDTHFTVTQPDAGTVLGPLDDIGSETTFQITYNPGTLASHYATITIQNTDADEGTYTFVVAGQAVVNEPEIEVHGNGQEISYGDTNPSSSDFTYYGDIPLGQSLERIFYIYNKGAGVLQLLSSPKIVLSGEDADNFSVSVQPSQTTINDKTGEDTFQITYAPKTTGVHQATVEILNTDPDENFFTFTIQGNASDSLLLWLPFDETSGTTAYDLSDYGHHGTIGDQVTMGNTAPDPALGTSFAFDHSGDGSIVWVEDLTDIDHDNLSLSMWFRYTGGDVTAEPNTGTLFQWGTVDWGDDQFMLASYSPDQAWARMMFAPSPNGYGNYGSPAIAYLDGNWHFLNVVFSKDDELNSSINVYYDNATNELSKTGSYITVNPTTGITIGMNDIFTNSYYGELDDIKVFSKALSVAEIQAMYANPNEPEIVVQGGGQNIANNDAEATVDDDTDFSEVGTTGYTEVRTFTVLNYGSGNLTLNSNATFGGNPIGISGGNTADFSISQQPAISIIKPGMSATFQVTFDPTVSGILSSTVVIDNDDSDEGSFSFAVSGNGQNNEPNIAVYGGGLEIAHNSTSTTTENGTDYDSVNVDSGSVERIFVIKNIGTGNLVLNGSPYKVTLTGNTNHFSITGQPSTNKIVPGNSLNFKVTYNPNEVNEHKTTVHILTNDPDTSDYCFQLRGVGLSNSPDMVVKGNEVEIADGDTTPSTADYTDFGETPSNGSGVIRTFFIHNYGGGYLEINSASLVELSDATHFQVQSQLASSIVLSSDSESFSLIYNPVSAGTHTVTVSIPSNDPDHGIYNFDITGTAPTGNVVITGNSTTIASGDSSPSTDDYTDFGTAMLHFGELRTFTITNNSVASLSLTGTPVVSLSNTEDFRVLQQPSPSLAASGSVDFTVHFLPKSAGAKSATVTIESSDDDSPYTFDIGGTGSDHTQFWLPLDETSGSTAEDATANNRDGTWGGAVSAYSDGAIRGAMDFPGADADKLTVADYGSVGDEFMISIWARRATDVFTDHESLYYWSNSSTDQGVKITFASGIGYDMTLRMGDHVQQVTAGYFNEAALWDDEWVHIIHRGTSGGQDTFFNNSEIADGDPSWEANVNFDPDQAFAFGGSVKAGYTDEGWDGQIDDIRVYNAVASDAAVNQFYKYHTERTLTYSGNVFNEAGVNDGSIDSDSTLILTIANGHFLGSEGDDLAAGSGNVTISNLPAGLSVSMLRNVDGSQLTISISGTATNHNASDSVSNVTFDFQDAAFFYGVSGSVLQYSTDGIAIQFDDGNTPVITYTTEIFYETTTNDGSLDTSSTAIEIVLANDSWTGSEGDDLASGYGAGGNVDISNLPAGLTPVMTRNATGNVLTLTFSGTANSHEDANDVSNLTFDFQDSAFTNTAAAGVTNASNSSLSIDFLEPYPAIQYSTHIFYEDSANDGSTSDTMTITLTSGSFSGVTGTDITGSGNITTLNVPTGLTAVFTKTADSTIEVTMTGTASQHTKSHSFDNMAFTFTNAAFDEYSASEVLNYTTDTLEFSYLNPPAEIKYSSYIFHESDVNDGTMDNFNPVYIELIYDKFIGSVGQDLASYVTVNNLPSGLTAVFQRNYNGDRLTVTFTGSATNHESSNDVTNLGFTFLDGIFQDNSDAADVVNYTTNTLEIDFTDPYPVLTYSAAVFNEAPANDGTINNLSPISITLQYDTFTGANGVDYVATGNVAVSNLPTGLTAVLTKISDTELQATITGTASSHLDSNDVTDLTFTFQNGAFSSGDASLVVDYLRDNLMINFQDPSSVVLTYGDSDFTEAAANDGSIDDTMVITLTGDTFTGTDGSNLNAAGNVSFSNLPSGLSVVLTRNSAGNQLTMSFTGNAANHDDVNDVSALGITFADGAFDSTSATGVDGYQKVDMTIDFRDTAVLTYSGNVFYESVVNDGTIDNGSPITITLTDDTFVGTTGDDLVASGNLTVNNVPTGLIAHTTRNITGTQLIVCLYGNAADHAASDSISNLEIIFQDSAFTNSLAAGVTNYSNSTIGIQFDDPRTISYSTTSWTESGANDGSIATTVTITLSGDTFTGSNSDDFVSATKITPANVPSGLTVVATRTSDTTIDVTLTGTAASHTNSDDVSNFTLTFDDAAFTEGNAAYVDSYNLSNLVIDFTDDSAYIPRPGVSLGYPHTF